MASISSQQQITRTYTSDKAMRKDMEQMQRAGYRVVSQDSHQPRAGLGRIILLGFFSLLFKPKMRFTVVYERI